MDPVHGRTVEWQAHQLKCRNVGQQHQEDGAPPSQEKSGEGAEYQSRRHFGYAGDG